MPSGVLLLPLAATGCLLWRPSIPALPATLARLPSRKRITTGTEMKTLLVLWERHMAAWHRVDDYLAKQRGDLPAQIDAKARASECIDRIRQITGRLYV